MPFCRWKSTGVAAIRDMHFIFRMRPKSSGVFQPNVELCGFTSQEDTLDTPARGNMTIYDHGQSLTGAADLLGESEVSEVEWRQTFFQ